MTEKNPPNGDSTPEGASQADPTAHWWEQPTAASGAPDPARSDPTMIGAPTTPFGGYGQYTPPPQPYAAPQPPPQPYTAPPQQYSGPQGFPQQPPPYQRPKSSKAPWLIAGGVALVLVLGLFAGCVALVNSAKDSLDSGGGNAEGNYSMAGITDACSLIDTSSVTKWAKTPAGVPEHTETQPKSYTGGELKCSAKYKESSSSSKYHTNTADIRLEVSFLGDSSFADHDYDSWKQYDTGTTGSGRTSGDVTGLGEQGYWHSEVRDYSSSAVTDYTVAVQDSNVSVKVEISIDRADGDSFNKEEVATVAKEQVRKALAGLKK
ncbi:hypothetical protein [Nocardia sp. XZ_19_385]|uniref:hypothetical protein n=1 Tax=Nocardia sp. XZ_19_385 TaxID=2769488 RepID=UPI0018908BD4|nr:hypothetical protein [Nocardia sp. XZ_19_385]